MASFEVFVRSHSGGGITDRRRDVAETRGDCEIEGDRRSAAPPGEINVSRTTGFQIGRLAVFSVTANCGARLKKAWFFQLRVEAR